MARRFPLRDLSPAVWGLMILCVLPELILSGADYGLWGRTQWRGIVYGWGGFWPGLLHDWQPNFPGQALAMFVTYGFLHGGLVHLGVNMASLVSLGRAVEARVGQSRFLAIYAAALVGGGLGFGILANTAQPMVGASGALFGLAGAVIVWATADRLRLHATLWPVVRGLTWLVALNVILWVATGGLLAWQTHLGGFVVGALAGWALDI